MVVDVHSALEICTLNENIAPPPRHQVILPNPVTSRCPNIFYGHGFSLFGQVDRMSQSAIVAAIWVFQLIASSIWLRYFLFGSFEWLWRSLTYLKLQPCRRRLLPDAH